MRDAFLNWRNLNMKDEFKEILSHPDSVVVKAYNHLGSEAPASHMRRFKSSESKGPFIDDTPSYDEVIDKLLATAELVKAMKETNADE